MSASAQDEDITEAGAATTTIDVTETAAVPAATHHVPEGGMDWWSDPDPSQEPAGSMEANVPVAVLEDTTGWARVQASNGWEGWVDAGLLERGAASRARMEKAARISIGLSLVGAALVIVGGFLPWYSAGGADASAWDIRLVALLTHEPTDVSLDAGPILLITALSALALLLRRPLPAWAALALAGVPLLLGVAGLTFYLDLPGSGTDLGIGVIATLAGAVVMLAGLVVSPRMVPRPLVRIT
ncbi:MAG TPA: SH3 domain-containing protein [Acidimicrobiia bacterium]|jgi:hypothetical protein